jgi:hypothetical protein
MKNKIPTAEEFLKDNSDSFDAQMRRDTFYRGTVESLCIEFAKLHVEKALKAASEKVVMYDANDIDNPEEDESGIPYEYYTVDKNSILNAYPLNNIK